MSRLLRLLKSLGVIAGTGVNVFCICHCIVEYGAEITFVSMLSFLILYKTKLCCLFLVYAGNNNSLQHVKEIKIGYFPSLFISSSDSRGSIVLFAGFCFGLFLSVLQETKTKTHSLLILFEWLMYP